MLLNCDFPPKILAEQTRYLHIITKWIPPGHILFFLTTEKNIQTVKSVHCKYNMPKA